MNSVVLGQPETDHLDWSFNPLGLPFEQSSSKLKLVADRAEQGSQPVDYAYLRELSADEPVIWWSVIGRSNLLIYLVLSLFFLHLGGFDASANKLPLVLGQDGKKANGAAEEKGIKILKKYDFQVSVYPGMQVSVEETFYQVNGLHLNLNKNGQLVELIKE